jgi:UDP-glucose 4-epimerase
MPSGASEGGGIKLMRSAIVTGGAGFIGSHVVDALVSDGVGVVVVDDLSTGARDRVNDGAVLEEVDIVDRERLRAVFESARPDAVFHLAAQSSVTASVADPARDCAVNVAGTLNVLEASQARTAPVVFASTGGALYGDDAPLPTPEDRLPVPAAPYGASKVAGEAYVQTWAGAHGVPHAICRLGNVYGPRQSPHGEAGVVAIFSHHLHQGRAPRVFGHGEPTRDYVHVGDVVEALLRASGTRGVFNVGTGIETSVRTVLGELQRAAGTSVEPALEPLRPGELSRSCLDPSRAFEQLGWRARTGLSEGLRSTYRALVDEFDAAERRARPAP